MYSYFLCIFNSVNSIHILIADPFYKHLEINILQNPYLLYNIQHNGGAQPPIKVEAEHNDYRNNLLTYINMKNYLYPFIIVTLLIVLSIQHCTVKPEPKSIDDRVIENVIREKVIYTYKDSIIIRDSLIITYVSIKDSISKRNKNTLDNYYNDQTETETMNRDECDTIIESLVAEIEISDTIISELNKTIEHRDTVINSLEIINHNFESILTDIEKELVKVEKKRRNNKIWMWIMTSIAAVTTTILIVN